ncbi:MAG: two-component regulator propeller domain-containing protein, partial [Limisphaerales bacterium]
MNGHRFRACAQSALWAAVVSLAGSSGMMAAAETFANPAAARRYVMREWTTVEGLPHNGIGALLQTRDGYLWVGTQNGLARFDGVQFRAFGLREGLPHLSITALLEDREGGIWIGTEGGLCRLYRERFPRWTANEGLPGNYLMGLAEDGAGVIWAGTTRGLARWRGDRFEPVLLQPALTNVYIRALSAAPDGTLWVATLHQGIFRQNGDAFEAVPGPLGLRNVSAYTLWVDAAGRVWVALSHWVTVEGDRLLCWDNGGWRTFGPKDGLPDQYLTRVVSPADGSAWAGSLDQGLYEWRDGQFAALRRTDGLADDAISALLLDHDENLWVGTVAGGLQRLSARRLETHPVLDAGEERLATTLAQTTDGRLWVGTPGRGLFEWREDQFEQLLRVPPIAGHLQVEALLASRDGGLWWGAGPALYQWRDGRLAARHDSERWLQGDRVVALAEDADGTIWVGTLNGQLRPWRAGRFGPPVNRLAAGPIAAIART